MWDLILFDVSSEDVVIDDRIRLAIIRSIFSIGVVILLLTFVFIGVILVNCLGNVICVLPDKFDHLLLFLGEGHLLTQLALVFIVLSWIVLVNKQNGEVL